MNTHEYAAEFQNNAQKVTTTKFCLPSSQFTKINVIFRDFYNNGVLF